MKEELERSIRGVAKWVESRDYRGYEPSDGNLSPLHVLTFSKPLPERILQQVVWKSPFDIRRLLGVPPHRSTKGMGYMARGYAAMYRLSRAAADRERAEACLDWLMRNRAPGLSQFAWGDSFPFSSRGGRRPAFEPTLVWSSLIGHAFLDAYETFGTGNFFGAAQSVGEWVKTLPRRKTDVGICLAYSDEGPHLIHNANMLGAGFLSRLGRLAGDSECFSLAGEAMAFSCSRQNPDGSWPYGEGLKYRWIDSFHTGYNLDSLAHYLDSTGDAEFRESLRRGRSFFLENFIEPDGRPKYYFNRIYPIDIQCAAQAVESLVVMAKDEPSAVSRARAVAAWTIQHMQEDDGHFAYRDLGWRKVRTPMFHWGQATMFHALAKLLTTIQPVEVA